MIRLDLQCSEKHENRCEVRDGKVIAVAKKGGGFVSADFCLTCGEPFGAFRFVPAFYIDDDGPDLVTSFTQLGTLPTLGDGR